MNDSADFAVIRSGGKQYRVSPGTRVCVERLSAEPGSTIELGEVLLLQTGGKTTLGSPFVSGAAVKARVVQPSKGPKVIAFKKRKRKGFMKKIGHRQKLTEIEIESISA